LFLGLRNPEEDEEEEKKSCSLRAYESWCVVDAASDRELARKKDKRGGE